MRFKRGQQRKVKPVIISAKRMEGILYRACMGRKRDQKEAKEEDERYMQYLKDGSDALCSIFTNFGTQSLDEEKQARLDQELKEAAIREKKFKLEEARTRKIRVLRANRILQDLKPGPQSLHHAQVLSEVCYQRKYNTALNKEILEDADRQQRLDEKLCPEKLIPFGNFTEEELKAQEVAKAAIVKDEFLKDLARRREERIEAREDEITEGIIEREQYKCLKDEEDEAARKLAARKRLFCQLALQDARYEKAKIAKFEEMDRQIQDRVDCVAETMRRNMDKRFNSTVKALKAKVIAAKDARARRISQMQKAAERKEMEYNDGIQEKYEFECDVNQARRECEVAELAKQRRAYQEEERLALEQKRMREAQIHCYHVASRFKNEETNKRFSAQQKRKKDQDHANLRKILFGQRDEAVEKRYQELMRMSECQVDDSVQDDKLFFQDVVKAMVKARAEDRLMYPIAKAAERYRRGNQIDMVPEGRSVRRSRLRDYCWPGYHSKADFAYRNYQHREECRELQALDRHDIFANCVKITSMAAEENPYKPCVLSCPVKCFQHRGVPATASGDSFDVICRDVCYNDPPLVETCPSHMQVVKNCEPEKPAETPKKRVCPEDSVDALPDKSNAPVRELPFIKVLSHTSIAKKPSNASRASSAGTLKSAFGYMEIGNKNAKPTKSTPVWR